MSHAQDTFGTLSVLLVVSLPLSLAALTIAIPAAMFAMNKGYAGWLIATLAGGLVGSLIFAFFLEIDNEGLLAGSLFGMAFGAVFWIGARVSTPAAFIGA